MPNRLKKPAVLSVLLASAVFWWATGKAKADNGPSFFCDAVMTGSSEYRRRTAELEALYRLVPGRGPVTYTCDGDRRNEVIVMFFPTDPPTLYAERGDGVSLMFLQPSASGTKYQGRNETFWEHQGEAKVTWGYGAPVMSCEKLP
jgi:membrane-bound inhibitor of C-type lysozyme